MRPSARRFLALVLVAAPLAALAAAAPEQFAVVVQKDRAFGTNELVVDRGTAVRFTNEDDFPHQISISGPGLDWKSGLQGPGEPVEVVVGAAGTFQVRCGIHPRMRMAIRAR